jgi:hypothetical protein
VWGGIISARNKVAESTFGVGKHIPKQVTEATQLQDEVISAVGVLCRLLQRWRISSNEEEDLFQFDAFSLESVTTVHDGMVEGVDRAAWECPYLSLASRVKFLRDDEGRL